MKKGLASVWARAWRVLTCSDIVVDIVVGHFLFPGKSRRDGIP